MENKPLAEWQFWHLLDAADRARQWAVYISGDLAASKLMDYADELDAEIERRIKQAEK